MEAICATAIRAVERTRAARSVAAPARREAGRLRQEGEDRRQASAINRSLLSCPVQLAGADAGGDSRPGVSRDRVSRRADADWITLAEDQVHSPRRVTQEEREARNRLSQLVQENDGIAISSLLSKHPTVCDLRITSRGVTALYEAVKQAKPMAAHALVQARAHIKAPQGDLASSPDSTPWSEALIPPVKIELLAIMIESPSASPGELADCAEDLFRLAQQQNASAYAVYKRACERLRIKPMPPPGSGGYGPPGPGR